jgi:ribonuclease
MKAADADRTAIAQSPGEAREAPTGEALSVTHDSVGLLIALQRSVGNAAVSQLVTQRPTPAPRRGIQRGVYAEAGTKAVTVPQYAKAHAIWVKARDKPGGRLDNVVVPIVLPSGQQGFKYEKHKGRWYVGHMVFNNGAQPDGNRLPLTDTYREYDVHEWRPPTPRGKERIVVGASRRTWYTDNHYVDFTEFA